MTCRRYVLRARADCRNVVLRPILRSISNERQVLREVFSIKFDCVVKSIATDEGICRLPLPLLRTTIAYDIKPSQPKKANLGAEPDDLDYLGCCFQKMASQYRFSHIDRSNLFLCCYGSLLFASSGVVMSDARLVFTREHLSFVGISRNYTLDEDTYPKFVRDNNEDNGFLSLSKLRILQSYETAEMCEGRSSLCKPRRQRKRKTVVSDAGANIAEAEVDSFARHSIPVMTVATTVTSAVDPATTVKKFFDFIVGGIRTVISPGADLQKVYVPQWSVTNDSRLDDGRTCREMVDEFTPPKFFASIRGMEHDHLFTEFNVGAARQISLSAEVRMRSEYNIRERRRLNSVVEEKNSLLKSRDEEVENLKAQLLVKEAEAAKAIRLRAEVQTLADRNTVLEREKSELDVKVADLVATVKVREQEVADLDSSVTSVKFHNDNLTDQVHKLEVSSVGLQEKVTAYEDFIGRLEKFQDDRMREMNENFDKLDTDLVELALHLEERFYPHLLTTISGRRWLLTHGLELAIAKCLNSTEYLSSLGAAIGKAIKKGMQEGLSARITHGAEGRVLTNVAAYNPSTEADYLSALQHSLAKRLGFTESQPRVDQLMVPIHHSPDQRVIGASALSLSLDVSSSRVQRIRENIANHRSALRDVFVPLSEPLSATALTGMKVISATIDTPTTSSTTLAFVSIINLISIEDYEVAGTDGQEAVNESVPNDATGGNVNPFTNVNDVELNVS
ncbi:hypothetical protein Tco_0610326 [Tanacetum coccineum]